jgi:hypothetical protein
MPDPSRPPEWLMRGLMARYSQCWPSKDGLRVTESPPVKVEADPLAELGYDGSRLRRRYWKKVTER